MHFILHPALQAENNFRFCSVKYHHWNFAEAQTIFHWMIIPLNVLSLVYAACIIQEEILQAVLNMKSSFKKPTSVSLVCGRSNKTNNDSNAFQLVGNAMEHFGCSMTLDRVFMHK